jgi:hypothetical protein
MSKKKKMPRYLFWRGNSLWSRMPIKGFPEKYALDIRSTGTESDRAECVKLGEKALAGLRTKAIEGSLFDMKKEEPEKKPYKPKVWRLLARLWWFNLRFKTKGVSSQIRPGLKKFGHLYFDELKISDLTLWANEMRAEGKEIATVNLYIDIVKQAYTAAFPGPRCQESDDKKHIPKNPIVAYKRIPGANVRTELLTKDKFEEGYSWLKVNNPALGTFYLGLWESGRRPYELRQYSWEFIQTVEVEGVTVHFFNVPPSITKTDAFDTVIISPRLWATINQQAWRTGPVFRNPSGEKWWLENEWNRPQHFPAMRVALGPGAAGRWVRDCRRGFVTHKTEIEHCPPNHVMSSSGHHTMQIFNRYRIGQLQNKVAVMHPELRKDQGKSTPGGQFSEITQKVAFSA